MVRGADKRQRKFEVKVDPDTLAIQTRALKPLMVEGESQYFSEITALETKVKTLVETEGVSSLKVRDYLNYAREIYKLKTKFSGITLNVEAQLRVNKWADRGLAGSLLVKIANLVGVDPSPPPVAEAIDVIDRANRLLGIVYGSLDKLQQKPTTLELLVWINNFPSDYPLPSSQVADLKNIRLLSALDIVTVNNLLNPHPVSKSGTWNIDNLLNPHPVTQTSRALLVTKPEREDLSSLGSVASPNNAGVLIVAGVTGQKIKVYDAGFHGAVDGLHYFYFGTSTSPTTARFCSVNSKGFVHKTFVQPRVGASGDGLYLFSSVAETNMPYDVGYVQET